MKKVALARVRTVLETMYTPLRSNRARKDVVAFAEVNGTCYARLKSGKWTSTATWCGSKVDHFSAERHEAGRGNGRWDGGLGRFRGDSRKAVRGLLALGMVSKDDAEVARLHFWQIDRDKTDRETREDLKRDAKRLGVKLVFPEKKLGRR